MSKRKIKNLGIVRKEEGFEARTGIVIMDPIMTDFSATMGKYFGSTVPLPYDVAEELYSLGQKLDAILYDYMKKNDSKHVIEVIKPSDLDGVEVQ